MRTWSRFTSLLMAGLFIVAMLVPTVGLASGNTGDGENSGFSITATVPSKDVPEGEPITIPNFDDAEDPSVPYTQVAVGTPVTLKVESTGSEQLEDSNVSWSSSTMEASSGLATEQTGVSVVATPTLEGTYTYRADVTMEEPGTTERTAVVQVEFKLKVVGGLDVPSHPAASGIAGETVEVQVSWPKNTYYPNEIRYTWTADKDTSVTPPTLYTTSELTVTPPDGLSAWLKIPENLYSVTTYIYEVKPEYVKDGTPVSGYEYDTLKVDVEGTPAGQVSNGTLVVTATAPNPQGAGHVDLPSWGSMDDAPYTQVAVGTQVVLSLGKEADAGNYVIVPDCTWAVDEADGAGLGTPEDDGTIIATPTKAGTYTYIASFKTGQSEDPDEGSEEKPEEGSDNNETEQTEDETPDGGDETLSFRLNVVDQLVKASASQESGTAGQSVRLAAKWPDKTAYPKPSVDSLIRYKWEKNGDAPEPVLDTSGEGLDQAATYATITMPDVITEEETYSYTVTPQRYSDDTVDDTYKYVPCDISVKAEPTEGPQPPASEFWITASATDTSVGGAGEIKPAAGYKYTQVAPGTAVMLSIGGTIDGETLEAGDVSDVSWSSDPADGSGLVALPNSSIVAQPKKGGTFVYTAEFTAKGERRTARFSLEVVDLLIADPASPDSAQSGEKSELKAAWPSGTAYSKDVRYRWVSASTGAPNPSATEQLSGIPTGLSAWIQIPADLTSEQTYSYRVEPEYVDNKGPNPDYIYKPLTLDIEGVPVGDEPPGDTQTFTGTGGTVTWYAGNQTPPKLTAKFSQELQRAVWTCEKFPSFTDVQENPGSQVSTYTVDKNICSSWNATDSYTFICTGTSLSGQTYAVSVVVSVLGVRRPDLHGAVSLNSTIYETSAVSEACEAKALLTAPPALNAVVGAAASRMTSEERIAAGSQRVDPAYTYSWYKCDSQDYTISGQPLTGASTSVNGTASSLQLTANQLAEQGQTAYFACVVSPAGVDSAAARAQQNFAVTTVAAAELESASSGDDIPAVITPEQDLAQQNVVFRIAWDPPVAPEGLQNYTWSISEGPAGGELTVQTETGTSVLTKTSPVLTGLTGQSIQLMRVSAPGRYVVTCTPTGSGGSSYTPVTFAFVSGDALLSENLVMYTGTSGSNGLVNIPPSAGLSGNSIYTPANGRFTLYVPPQYINSADGVVTEWKMLRSATAEEESLPAGMGFYGVNDTTLVSGPVTSAMNGWQFCLTAYYEGAANAPASTQLVTLNVSGTPAAAMPVPAVTTTPAARGSEIRITTGGAVTFEAYAANQSNLSSDIAYQWYSQPASGMQQAIAGATSPTYTVRNVGASMNGQRYWCVMRLASSPSDEVRTPAYTLSVNTAPGAVRITNPTAPTLNGNYDGKPVTLDIAAETNGTGRISYQWYVRRSSQPVYSGMPVTSLLQARNYIGDASAVAVNGATTASYTVSSLQPGVWEYFCRATNTEDTSQSSDSASYYFVVPQALSVPVVTVPSDSVTYVGGAAGSPLTLNCTAYSPNGGSPTYQWQSAPSSTGAWSDVSGGATQNLQIAELSAQQNNQYYRCIVKNPATGESTASNPYMISVWNASSTPVVTRNPGEISHNVSVSSDSDPLYTVELTSAATLTDGTLHAQWQYQKIDGNDTQWYNVPDTNTFRGIHAPSTINGTSTLTLDANASSCAPSGLYRCVWLSDAQKPGAALVPQATSLPARVSLVYPGRPRITKQPVGADVEVGKQAEFTITADLGQSSVQGDTVVYIWQFSRDRGQTWTNCTSASDGSGQFSATFRTYAVTQAMYDQLAAASPGNPGDSIFMYRCIVANRRLSVDVVSDAVPLVIRKSTTPQGPAIVPGAGSTISVSGTGSGRYIGMINVTGSGITLEKFKQDLRYTVPTGYTLKCINANGTEVSSTSIIATGMKLQLVNSSGQTVDSATVVLKGDVLGTGKMTLSQLVRLARAYTGKSPLTGAYQRAGLIRGNETTIELNDIVGAAELYKKARQ